MPAATAAKKKVKELKVLDPKAAQNMSILLGASLKSLSFADVRLMILKCDDSSLGNSVLEALLRYITIS